LLSTPQFQSLSKDEGTPIWFINSLNIIKATSESTGGAYSLLYHVAPAGFATPYHLHHAEDEAFYMLEGEATFVFDGKKMIVGPGGYVFLPRGIPHGIRISGTVPATMLVLAMPGTGFVGLVMEMGEPAKEPVLPPITEPDTEKLARLCAKYGIEVLGPLP
jgi:mannose-6-phosphate isomerase-like protein (cupin superfamily)